MKEMQKQLWETAGKEQQSTTNKMQSNNQAVLSLSIESWKSNGNPRAAGNISNTSGAVISELSALELSGAVAPTKWQANEE